MKVYSKSIKNGYLKNYLLNGSNISLDLSWDKVENAKEYAVILTDKESTGASGFIFIHWVVSNIKENFLIENSAHLLQNKLIHFQNSSTKYVENKNVFPDFLKRENANTYIGPKPGNKAHQYELIVYALDTENLFNDLNKEKLYYLNDFENIIHNHIIDWGILTFLSPQIIENKIGNKIRNNLFFENNEWQKIENIKLDGQEYLDKKYLYKEQNNEIVINNDFLSPEISFNKIKTAKSYVVICSDSSKVQKWGSLLNAWSIYGINQSKNDKIIIKKNITRTKQIQETFNSYKSSGAFDHNLEIDNIFSKTKKYNQGFLIAFSEIKFNITITVYATNLDPSEFVGLNRAADILEFIGGSIISMGIKIFPIK